MPVFVEELLTPQYYEMIGLDPSGLPPTLEKKKIGAISFEGYGIPTADFGRYPIQVSDTYSQIAQSFDCCLTLYLDM